MRKLIDLCENAINPIIDWTSKDTVAIPLMKLRRVILDVKRMAEEYRTRYGEEASGSGSLLDAIERFEKQFLVCHPLVNALGEGFYTDELVSRLSEARDVITKFVTDNFDNYKKSALYGKNMTRLFVTIEDVALAIQTAIIRLREVVTYKEP